MYNFKKIFSVTIAFLVASVIIANTSSAAESEPVQSEEFTQNLRNSKIYKYVGKGPVSLSEDVKLAFDQWSDKGGNSLFFITKDGQISYKSWCNNNCSKWGDPEYVQKRCESKHGQRCYLYKFGSNANYQLLFDGSLDFIREKVVWDFSYKFKSGDPGGERLILSDWTTKAIHIEIEREKKRVAEEEVKLAREQEHKRLAEKKGERVAEVERKAEAERKAKAKAQQVAEEKRKVEAKRKKNAKEEAQRVAEAKQKQRAKEEARRVAEAEQKQRAKEEAQRVAEAERKRKEKEDADQKQLTEFKSNKSLSYLFKGTDNDILFLFNETGNAEHGIRGLDGKLVFENNLISFCGLFGFKVDPSIRDYVALSLSKTGVSGTLLPKIFKKCGDLTKTTKDLIVFERGTFLSQPLDKIKGVLDLSVTRKLTKFLVFEFEAHQKMQVAQTKISKDLIAKVEKGKKTGFGLLLLGVKNKTVCAIKEDYQKTIKLILSKLRMNDPITLKGLSPSSITTASLNDNFLKLKRSKCGFFIANAGFLRKVILGLKRDKIKFSMHYEWVSVDSIKTMGIEEKRTPDSGNNKTSKTSDKHRQDLPSKEKIDSDSKKLGKIGQKEEELKKREAELKKREDAIKLINKRRKSADW